MRKSLMKSITTISSIALLGGALVSTPLAMAEDESNAEASSQAPASEASDNKEEQSSEKKEEAKSTAQETIEQASEAVQNAIDTAQETIEDKVEDIKENNKEMTRAKYAAFKDGEEVLLDADHMPGMLGATATVVAAYDTIAYEVSYIDETNGEQVSDHKWVVQEEIENFQDKPYKENDRIVLTADHHPGMKGAKAVIESVEKTTVYVVSYTPTDGSPEVTKHKWVIEDELKNPNEASITETQVEVLENGEDEETESAE